jgi:hypothetical protein
MGKKRKIALVVNKGTFAELESADDLYWSATNVEQRLSALIELRKTFLSNYKSQRIKKVVHKYNLYEEEARKS